MNSRNPRTIKKIVDELENITTKQIISTKFNKHTYGTIVAINGDTANITLLDSSVIVYYVKFRQGLDLQVGDNVIILCINNSMNNMLIDAKIDNLSDMVTNNLTYRKIKIYENFDDYTEWNSSTQDYIYYKLGNSCIKLTETNNTGGLLQTYKTVSYDFTAFDVGSSLDDDWICMPIYISDASFVDSNGIELIFETSGGNYYQYNVTSGLIDAYNYINIQKKNFTATGTPDWSNITKILIGWYSKNNAINVFVTFCAIFLAQNLISNLNRSIVTKTTDYVASNADSVIICDSSSPLLVTLPSCANLIGKTMTIKNINTGTVTIEGYSSENIDGIANKSLSVQWTFLNIITDGSNWFTI